ncbi:MAG TPA: lantibiotic dehydratase [Candidatus Saccharimonadales bacterium]|jgi:hypothetical protein
MKIMQTNMELDAELFPYILARIAGGPMQELTQLRLCQTPIILEQIAVVQLEIDQAKEALSDELHSLVAAIENSLQRNAVIRLRRDIYNERLDALPTGCEQLLASAQILRLKTYVTLCKKKRRLLAEGEACFEKECHQSKRNFHKLLQKPNLQNGILLSSNSLSKSLEAYLRKQDKPLPKVERSLMQYLSRMYTKPSPLSTFTSLAIAKLSKDLAGRSVKTDAVTKSHIGLNHYLFHYLIGLLVQNSEIRSHLGVRLNQTIRLDGEQFVFVANNFNRESVQRIRRTPALQAIGGVMQTGGRWTQGKLVQGLGTKQFTNTSSKALGSYIDTLLSYGFLEYDLGIQGVDTDWDQKLAKLVKQTLPPYPYLADLCNTLRYLRSATKQYETATPQKRAALLTNAFTKFRDTCLNLHIVAGLPEVERSSFTDGVVEKSARKGRAKRNSTFTVEYDTAFKFQPRDLWYEDTYQSAQAAIPLEIQASLTVLGNLLSRLGRLDECIEDLYRITDFFKQRYGTSARVDLLQFYEAYYRDEKARKRTERTPGLSLASYRKRKKRYLDVFMANTKSRIDGKHTVEIVHRDIAHMDVITSASFGAYFQIIAGRSGTQQLVINSTVPGFGNMYSRFLLQFGSQVTRAFREWNTRGSEAVLLAEPADASVFNANLHPNLMPYVITSSGSYTALPPGQRIPVTDIEVMYRQLDDRVILFHKKKQKEIIAFDMAFGPGPTRARLYEFLSYFMPGPHHHTHTLVDYINRAIKKNSDKDKAAIIILPRIVYEGSIILQRKTWEVPYGQLVTRSPGENEWEYFRKVDNWRRQLGMPDEVFVRLGPDKPQYIDFANPFLVVLLEKMGTHVTVDTRLTIGEMTPNTEQIATVYGQKRATEFLSQWYS